MTDGWIKKAAFPFLSSARAGVGQTGSWEQSLLPPWTAPGNGAFTVSVG